MTYLALLNMNPRSRAARRDMADPASMHRTLMSLFPQAQSGAARDEFAVLWRVEHADTPTVLLQAAHASRTSLRCQADTPPTTSSPSTRTSPVSRDGGIVYYRAVLNPTRSSRMHATNRQHVIPSADRADWWESRARSAGLVLLDKPSTDRATRPATSTATEPDSPSTPSEWTAPPSIEHADSPPRRHLIWDRTRQNMGVRAPHSRARAATGA